MLSVLTRITLLVAGIYALYRYRYRIFNRVFGNAMIRKLFITTSMKVPYIRNRMIHQAFR
ncbi:hypothetical protein [Fredinandcohnia quinoae]|uniref:Uncharacterized protein n=1 Tax=Fredinandcohnia quinoae TaxID=2918902 RepID=A0AAW5DWB1_9BACI|nr:hypothetical protein [Fredinandcohnia sp. SECRCQ15]MCH1624930.1 hypothetical protein [Fredinandcohnia sp. SECRCQ15]